MLLNRLAELVIEDQVEEGGAQSPSWVRLGRR